MPIRGLIVAIENYPKSNGSVAHLVEGAIDAGEKFGQWLIATKRVIPSDILVCSDGGIYDPAVRRYGVERRQIVDAFCDLVSVGQNQTEELYVFFSGHGFTYQEDTDKLSVAVMVAADFISPGDSGTECISLTEAQQKLWGYLGGLSHYYFVDACRNILNPADIELAPFGRKLGRAANNRPARYTLYSSKFGETADIKSPFAAVLRDGLDGKGKAKGYTSDHKLYVMFQQLKNYVADHMPAQKIDFSTDGGDGYILRIDPIPTYKCKVTVEGAAATDPFVLKWGPAGQPQFARLEPFTGAGHEFDYQPDNLMVDVLEAGQPLELIDPPPATPPDFFDPCSVRFRRPQHPVLLDTRSVTVMAPPDRDVRAINLNTAEEVHLSPGATKTVGDGDWELSVLERGTAIAKQVIDTTGLASVNLALPPSAVDPIRNSIVLALRHNNPAAPVVDFSEQMQGPTANKDLGLWLTIMAASRIIGPYGFDKLSDLPLLEFSSLRAGETATFVVSALEQYDRVRVAADSPWTTLDPVPGMVRVRQNAFRGEVGPRYVSFQLDQQPVRTMASWNLPNWVTLVVLSQDDDDRLVASQFLIPASHLLGELPVQVQSYLQKNINSRLRMVRTMYTFQRFFGRGRPLNPPDPEERIHWNALLSGEWLDPITSPIVCYDAIRRDDGKLKDSVWNQVLQNLRTSFAGLPDIAAMTELINPINLPAPANPPLFTEGLLAFPDWTDHLRYPAAKLDYGALWTTWEGAVQ